MFIVIWVATLILDMLNHGPPNWIIAIIMIGFSLLLVAAYTVAFSLMAKDIDDFRSTNPNTNCTDAPGGWGAALAFAIFGFLGWIGMAIIVVVWVLVLFFADKPAE